MTDYAPFQPVNLIVHTEYFHHMAVRLFTKNLDASYSCRSSLLVTTQASPRHMGEQPCLPYCGLLTPCPHTGTTAAGNSLQQHHFECDCPRGRCNDFAVYIPHQSWVNPNVTAEICCIHHEYIYQ